MPSGRWPAAISTPRSIRCRGSAAPISRRRGPGSAMARQRLAVETRCARSRRCSRPSWAGRRGAGQARLKHALMRRILILAVLAAVVIAAATVADYPGSVDIVWQGWEIETSVGVLIAAWRSWRWRCGCCSALSAGLCGCRAVSPPPPRAPPPRRLHRAGPRHDRARRRRCSRGPARRAPRRKPCSRRCR